MKKRVETPGIILPGVEDITRRDFLVGGAGLFLPSVALVGESR